MNAAVGPVPYETSYVRGPNPLHYLERHGGEYAITMDNPIPTTNPSKFDSNANHLAARVDGSDARNESNRDDGLAGSGPTGAPHGSGSQALVPHQGGAASHGQFSLVYQVAGADSLVDTFHDGLA